MREPSAKWAWGAAASALANLLLACTDAADAGDAVPGQPDPQLGNLALEFDGVSQYATSGTAAFPFGTNPHTVSFWADPWPDMRPQAMVALRREFQSGVVVGLRGGTFEAWSAYHGRTYARATMPLWRGWFHLAYVWTGFEHLLYMNGERVGWGDEVPQNRTPTSCWIGSLDGFLDMYAGRMDELRIWSVARSDEQIALEAKGKIEEDLSTLVAYFPFDERTGIRSFDRSGLGNHASLGDGVAERAPKRIESEIETP